MRDDLLEAEATIDWAVAQLPSLQDRLNRWISNNTYSAFEDENPETSKKTLVVREKEALPLAFSVEVGSYVNVIRSSLDMLAVALATRNRKSLSMNPHFRVWDSLQEAIDPLTGIEGIKWLSKAEIEVIKQLKPYKGGNDLLWSLHHLDIERKHKRLLTIIVQPQNMKVIFRRVGMGMVWPPCWPRREDNKTLVAIFDSDMSENDIHVSVEIAINETTIFGQKPVAASIREFARLAHSIIGLFDIP